MKRMAMVGLAALVACGCSTSKPLFNGEDLSGWVEVGSDGAWSVQDGLLVCSGEKTGYAWLSTEEKYGDFELTLEWRIPEGANAGVFLRVPSREGRASQLGLEVQIKDDRDDETMKDVTGAVFSRISAADKFSNPPGQWNTMKITLVDRQLRIELNDHLVSDTMIDRVKLGTEWSMVAIPPEGYIGLQNHGDPVAFRKVAIRVLE